MGSDLLIQSTRREFRMIRLTCLLLLLSPLAVMAAEIRVIAGGPLPGVFKELGPQFERDSGHKLHASFASTATVKRQIDDGAEFDVAVTAASAIDDWIKEGKVVAATRTPVAYAGLGLGVRAGAAKPDVGSADASRRTLLNINTLGHGPESASATALRNVLARLGITEEMKPKLRPIGGGMYKRLVAGELDAIVGAVPSIMAASGVELAGAFPPELQTYIPFAAAVSAGAKEPEGAQALIRFLTSPAATGVLRAKGLEPGAPR
jgi:molybdate transport system substrate-binding protein